MAAQVYRLGLISILYHLFACQDYPFEYRTPRRVEGKKISEVIATVAPTDILFVVDNSGSMQEEIDELNLQVGRFIEELAENDNEFQVGLITTDVDCNVPTMDCTVATGRTYEGCCFPANRPVCVDEDNNGDQIIERSNCDGGRLRAAPSTGRRIFTRPESEDRVQWIAEFREVLDNLGTNGSSYEAGLEAARRAIACAIGNYCTASGQLDCCDPEDEPVAQLNDGFIRAEADLVVIFLTDEDDCSVVDREIYLLPEDISATADQETHLCSPDECYAYRARIDQSCTAHDDCPTGYGCHLATGECQIDSDRDALLSWADATEDGYYICEAHGGAQSNRHVDPPDLDDVEIFVDTLVALKGGDISRVRAAGIIGSVASTGSWLGFEDAACVNRATGPSDGCGCWASSIYSDPIDSFYCSLTNTLGQGNDWLPVLGDGSGCKAMPSGRYVDFLRELASRRVEAQLDRDTLIDSICKASYQDTINQIVNTVIISRCFEMGVVPDRAGDIVVKLNDDTVPYVPRRCTSYARQGPCEAVACLWSPVFQCADDTTECSSSDDCVGIGDGTCEARGAGECIVPAEVEEDASGWSWRYGDSQVCLEGGVSKKLGDRFEIFLVTGSP